MDYEESDGNGRTERCEKYLGEDCKRMVGGQSTIRIRQEVLGRVWPLEISRMARNWMAEDYRDLGNGEINTTKIK